MGNFSVADLCKGESAVKIHELIHSQLCGQRPQEMEPFLSGPGAGFQTGAGEVPPGPLCPLLADPTQGLGLGTRGIVRQTRLLQPGLDLKCFDKIAVPRK